MAQLDNAADSDSEERGFESLWAGQNKASTLVVGALFFDSKGIRTRSPSRIGSPWRRCEGHKMRRFAKRTNSCGARIPLGEPEKSIDFVGAFFNEIRLAASEIASL